MAKKPTTIGTVKKQLKIARQKNDYYEKVLAYIIESEDVAEVVERVNEYVTELGLE